MIQKIIITADIFEKTAKFFGCKQTDTMTFTKVGEYFTLSLGCTMLVVTNLKITPSAIEFITIDDSGKGLLRFHNGELSIYEKDDKLMENIYNNAIYISEYLNWDTIECSDGNTFKDKDTISEEVYRLVKSKIK